MTPEELCKRYSPEIEALALKARVLIQDAVPGILEYVDSGNGALRYGPDAKMNNATGYIAGQAKHLNIGFYDGVNVPDPAHLLEGTGKRMRHVKIRQASELDNPALRVLIQVGYSDTDATGAENK